MDPKAPEQDELESSRAPFLEHLQELRWRLWRCVLAVIGCSVIGYLFHKQIFEFLTEPLISVMEKRGLPTVLKYRTVTGAFLFHFKTAILAGVFASVPIILYQLWQFVAPGLYKSEQRLALPFVFCSTLFFLGGAAFAYYQVLPYAFDFLLDFTIQTGGHRLEPDITVEDYLGFITKLLLAFGIVFEMPVATSFLASIGILTHRALIRFWRWAVVCAFVMAAILTPPDYITQIMLAIPLVVLYAVSIGIAFLITRTREARQDLDDEDDDEDDAEEEPESVPATSVLPMPPKDAQ